MMLKRFEVHGEGEKSRRPTLLELIGQPAGVFLVELKFNKAREKVNNFHVIAINAEYRISESNDHVCSVD